MDYSMVHEEADELQRMIARYFTTEDFGVKAAAAEIGPESEEVATARATLESTLVRKGDRFEVGLLWRSKRLLRFPDTYQNALHQLERLEQKLAKQPNLQSWALRTFRDYTEQGYIRKLAPSELLREDVLYLSHFVTEDKQPRIVFDAAAQVRGVSLNSQLLPGPPPDNLTPPLFGVLIRCREQQWAIAANIEEMFHRVKVRESDQHFQRILWRECEPDRAPDVYVVQVLTSEATCSLSCAQAARNRNAEELADRYPLARGAILRQHYVDDYIDSFASLATAKDTVEQVMQAHDEGGFRLSNFTSNSRELLASIPADRRHPETDQPLTFEEKTGERILAMFWDTDTDRFGFRVNYQQTDPAILRHSRPPTKREVLRFGMSINDPLGLISHVAAHGHVLMREVHLATENWDEPIPERLCPMWESYVRQLEVLNGLTVPRCIKLPAAGQIQLHTFVGASKQAFAACVYASSTANGQRYVQLIAAKVQIAPLKPLSLPRLELQAAVLGTWFASAVQEELRLPVESSTFWSDSRTVLAWIQTTGLHRKDQQFVALRVQEILTTTQTTQWRWVPSSENPAGMATSARQDTQEWFHGPGFLQVDDEAKWPVLASATHDESLPFCIEDRYSDWRRLIRHIAYLNKFVRFLRHKAGGPSFEKRFSVADFDEARRAMFRKAQQDSYSEDLAAIRRQGHIEKGGILATLNPFLDEHGVMRVRGAYVLLPQKHKITKLIVREYHERGGQHQPDNVVIDRLHQRFWILNLRVVLKNVKKCCQWCILRAAKPLIPPLVPLPRPRVTPNQPPFSRTAVDYFGPIQISNQGPRWGALFTCLNTGAVHIEVAEQLDVDSFLVCLRKHCRGSAVRHLYGANGTDFVGAETKLRRLVTDLDSKMGATVAAELEVEWHFNRAATSDFGSAWERQNQAVKRALRTILADWHLSTVEVLRATLTNVEFLLNSRPLTHIPIAHEGEEVRSPFHFLIGRAGGAVPPSTSTLEPDAAKRAQHLVRLFWDRWLKEYLPTLIRRNRWTGQVERVKEGDLVILVEHNAPPGEWLRGVVEKLHSEPDGQVRKVDVRFARGTRTRAVTKIAVVEVGRKEDPLERPPRKRFVRAPIGTAPAVKQSRVE